MKKNKTLIAVIIFLALCLLFGVYLTLLRNVSSTIDFSSCDDSDEKTCDYKIKLGYRIYDLVYEKSYVDLEAKGLEGTYYKLYFNNEKIMELGAYNEVLSVTTFKDLMIFKRKMGPSTDGYFIEIYNTKGKLIKTIRDIGNIEGMTTTPYWNTYATDTYDSTLREYYYLEGDNLYIYASKICESAVVYIDDKEVWLSELKESVSKGEISDSEPLVAKYKITYDGIIKDEEPMLVETIATVEQVADYHSE